MRGSSRGRRPELALIMVARMPPNEPLVPTPLRGAAHRPAVGRPDVEAQPQSMDGLLPARLPCDVTLKERVPGR
jgi:hypothetical protein